MVEALPDRASWRAAKVAFVWRQGQLRMSEQEQRQFVTIAREHERLERWLLCVTWAKECAAAPTVPTLNL